MGFRQVCGYCTSTGSDHQHVSTRIRSVTFCHIPHILLVHLCFLVFPVYGANRLFRNFCIFEFAYISEIMKSQVNISAIVHIVLIHSIGMKLESRFRYNRSTIMQNFADRYPFFKSFAHLMPCKKLSCTSAFIDCETEPFQHIRQSWYSISIHLSEYYSFLAFKSFPNIEKQDEIINWTYIVAAWFLHMICDICNIHSHRRYLRAIKLSGRRCHISEHCDRFAVNLPIRFWWRSAICNRSKILFDESLFRVPQLNYDSNAFYIV